MDNSPFQMATLMFICVDREFREVGKSGDSGILTVLRNFGVFSSATTTFCFASLNTSI
jgi:hypothetical protein